MPHITSSRISKRAVPIADLAHALEIARKGGDAAGGGADHRFCDEGDDGFRTETLELVLQFVGEPIDVLRIGLIVAFETIGEAGGDEAECRRQDRLVQRATHHVAAGAERAERVAVVALAARDKTRALRLADLDEILPRQLQRRLGAFGAGRAEPRMREAAGFAVQHDVRQVLGGLADERAGMGIGHCRGLPADGGGDALVAVAEARNRGAT